MFLQYMDCRRLLESIEKELGFMCLKWGTTDRIDHIMTETDNMEFWSESCLN